MFGATARQVLFRPADCDHMTRCVKAVLAFAEHPAVGGSRMFGPEVNLPGMALAMDQLPDIGNGPKALLLHAIDNPPTTSASVSRPFTPLDTWLAVRAAIQVETRMRAVRRYDPLTGVESILARVSVFGRT